jgi:hypothetical protein
MRFDPATGKYVDDDGNVLEKDDPRVQSAWRTGAVQPKSAVSFDAGSGNYVDATTGARVAKDDPRVVAAWKTGSVRPAPGTEAAAEAASGATFERPAARPTAEIPSQPMAGAAAPADPLRRESKVTTTSTSTTKIGKAEQKALDELDQANEARLEIAKREGEARQKAAAIKEQQASEEALAKATRQERVNAILGESEKQLVAEKAAADEAHKRYVSMGPKGIFEGQSTGNQIIAGISIALGALGGALSGRGGNQALEIIKGAVDRDFTVQRENALRGVERADKRLADVAALKVAKLRDLDIKEAAAYDTIAARYAAQQSKLGKDAAAIEADSMYQALRQEALTRRQKVLEGTRQQVQSTVQRTVAEMDRATAAGGKPTNEQLKAGAAAERLVTLMGELDAVKPISREGIDTMLNDATREEALAKHPNTKLALTTLGKYKTLDEKLSPNDRAYYQTMREITAIILRKESGSAISAEEIRDTIKRYTPAQGDSSADIARKRRALDEAVRAIGKEGPAQAAAGVDASLRQRSAGQPQPAAGAQQPTPIRVRDKKTGKVIDAIRLPDGRIIGQE